RTISIRRSIGREPFGGPLFAPTLHAVAEWSSVQLGPADARVLQTGHLPQLVGVASNLRQAPPERRSPQRWRAGGPFEQFPASRPHPRQEPFGETERRRCLVFPSQRGVSEGSGFRSRPRPGAPALPF